MEFIKDTSAIANTFGPDGFIIIGYDDKTKTFAECNFADSSLRDTSSITDIINKNVDRMFSIHYYEVEALSHTIGVLHIPPSIDKPHVIRLYKTFKGENQIPHEHRIFIRKGTSTFPASKYDLDLMYYDRKNIQPDYEIYVSFSASKVAFFRHSLLDVESPIRFRIAFSIENTGKRPVSITSFLITASEFTDPSDYEIYQFVGTDQRSHYTTILQSGEMQNVDGEFNSKAVFNQDQQKEIPISLKSNFRRLGVLTLNAVLSTGDQISCNLTLTR